MTPLHEFNADVAKYGRLHHEKRIADIEATVRPSVDEINLLKQSRQILQGGLFWGVGGPLGHIEEPDADDIAYMRELDEWDASRAVCV